MTATLRVRIVDPLVATTAHKVVRKTPPCASKRGRQNLDVLESAERVSQDHFDATVSHDRVHLRTIAVPLRPGIAPSKLSRLLGGSVL